MRGRPPELGTRVTGWVLDEARWQRDDRIRIASPAKCASGSVTTVYPYAPAVVGIRTDAGARIHVKLDGSAR